MNLHLKLNYCENFVTEHLFSPICKAHFQFHLQHCKLFWKADCELLFLFQRSMVMLSESFDRRHGSSVINGFSFCELDMVERIRVTEPIWHLKQLNRAATIHLLLSKPSGVRVSLFCQMTQSHALKYILTCYISTKLYVRKSSLSDDWF